MFGAQSIYSTVRGACVGQEQQDDHPTATRPTLLSVGRSGTHRRRSHGGRRRGPRQRFRPRQDDGDYGHRRSSRCRHDRQHRDDRRRLDLRPQHSRRGREADSGCHEHVRRQRPPERARHIRPRLRPLAGATINRRHSDLSAGRQSPRLQSLLDAGPRPDRGAKRLRVGPRRSRRHGRVHQPCYA